MFDIFTCFYSYIDTVCVFSKFWPPVPSEELVRFVNCMRIQIPMKSSSSTILFYMYTDNKGLFYYILFFKRYNNLFPFTTDKCHYQLAVTLARL